MAVKADVSNSMAYKFRIYPNKAQKELIEKNFAGCRFVYNHFLEERKRLYQEEKKSVNYFEQNRELTELKKDEVWLYDTDSQALQRSLKNLSAAYDNFFRRVKKGIKPYGFPKFKSRKNPNQSFTTTKVKILDNHIQLPKLGKIKCVVAREVVGKILSATVSRTPSQKYFVSICCSNVPFDILPKTGKDIGLDLGIKDLAITSDGIKYENHKYLMKSEKRLKRLQRSMSRKQKGSKNREKAKLKLARAYEKVSNQRRDNLHKMTSELIEKNDSVSIENLNASGMVKNHHLAKAVSDASFFEIRRQLEYKAAWHGRKIYVVDRFYPSSQLCSECGFKNETVKNLNVRKWTCPKCGAVHDRDVNAAINILHEGLTLSA